MASPSVSSSQTILAAQGLNENTIIIPNFNYSFFLPLERNFESKEYVNSLRLWMIENWSKSIIFAFIYILTIFTGKAYMTNKQKYELRGLLTVWNLLLAVFSAIGALRVLPELTFSINNYGFDYSICDNSYGMVNHFI
jgi:elongation of very long chain fatty acids protein 6